MIKIKVPKTIKVGGHTYEVKYKEHLSKDTDNRGLLQHRQQEIWIEPTNPVSQKDATLFHEIVHFINTVFAVGLREEDVDRVSEGLYQVLKDSFGIELDWGDIE